MKKDKRVLILASVASMIDQFNMPNIELLIDMGFNVHVACNFIEGNTCSKEQIFNLKNNLSNLGVEYYQIDFKRSVLKALGNLKAYKQVLNLMINNDYKFVHCHSPVGGFCGRLAGKATNTKVIYTAHGFHFYKGAPLINWIIYYPIEKWLSKYTDVLITINKEDYELAQKSFKVGKIEHLPGVGLDIDKINNVKVDRKLKRKEIGVPEDCFLLVSVGELNKNKNHQAVIKALAQINDSNIHYIVCGQGKLEKYLKDLSRKLGVDRQVHLLGYRKDIIEICKASDLFVFPSLREGLPVSLMEAMVCGLPIVCSNIRGNSDLVEENKGGYLVNANDTREIVNRIYRLYSDYNLRIKYGIINSNKIKCYGMKNIIIKLKYIYEQINVGAKIE